LVPERRRLSSAGTQAAKDGLTKVAMFTNWLLAEAM
jgi:hypothetical protein